MAVTVLSRSARSVARWICSRRWIELRTIATPGALLNRKIHFSQTSRRNPNCDHLADAHHHVPGDDFDSLRRKLVAEPRLFDDFVDLIHVLGLIVTKKDRE